MGEFNTEFCILQSNETELMYNNEHLSLFTEQFLYLELAVIQK